MVVSNWTEGDKKFKICFDFEKRNIYVFFHALC